jgi:hypothetical protein
MTTLITDFPNELLSLVFEYDSCERALIKYRLVSRQFSDVITNLLCRGPCPTNYSELVDFKARGKYFSIRRAVLGDKIDFGSLARFEGFLKKPGHFNIPELDNRGIAANFVAGAAEAGALRHHIKFYGMTATVKFYKFYPTAALIGTVLAHDWDAFDSILEFLKKIPLREDTSYMGVSINECLEIFIKCDNQFAKFKEFLKIYWPDNGYSVPINTEFLGELIVPNFVETSGKSWACEKNHCLNFWLPEA